MLDIGRRRPLVDAEQPRQGEALPATPVSPPAAPRPLTACPITNRRPRDLAQFQAAQAAAGTQPVIELDAVQAQPGMSIWHLGSFRLVADVGRHGGTVSLWLLGNGTVPSRYLDGHLPLYRLDGAHQ